MSPSIRMILVALAAFVFPLVVTAGSEASLVVHPNSLQETVIEGETGTEILHVTNIGPVSSLGYTIQETTSWLSASPMSGTIVRGDTADVTVTFDAGALAPGVYTANLTVVDPHHGPIAVQVRLTVEGAVETGVPRADGATGFVLGQNLPNPSHGVTSIEYRSPARGHVRLAIYDARGREVAVLAEGENGSGAHVVTWDTSGFARGVYFYRLEAEGFAATRRMVVR